MTYEPCKWCKSTKHKSLLDNFISERSTNIHSIYCENDTQIMWVNHIQCVKLDDIEKREPWSPSREETIRKWASPEKLRRLKYIREEETSKIVIQPTAFHDMPMLSKEYKLVRKEQEKFKISDGIYRINRARKLGIVYIGISGRTCKD